MFVGLYEQCLIKYIYIISIEPSSRLHLVSVSMFNRRTAATHIGITAHFVFKKKKLFIHLLLGCYSYVKWEPHQGSHNMSLNFCITEKIIIRRDYKQWLFFFQLTDKERLTWISEINIHIIYLLLFSTNFFTIPLFVSFRQRLSDLVFESLLKQIWPSSATLFTFKCTIAKFICLCS